MANTTYAFTKAVSITDYMPAFKSTENKYTWDWKKLVTTRKTNRATEQVFSYATLPVARETSELEPVYYADMAELSSTTFTVAKYTLATMFSHELLQDNQHLPDLMKEAGESMGESHSYIRDVAIASTYNRAFNSSYPMYDGVELCGTHYMNDGTEVDNDLTGASISFDNIWLMLNYFETSMYSHAGIAIRDTPKYIIYHPIQEQNIRAVLESELEPGVADNDKNTVKSYGLIPVSCRHLTTDTHWFIAGSKWPKCHIYMPREGVKTATEDDIQRMGTHFVSWQRFAHGPKEFLYIVGNPGP